ncbi:MAG: PKD domain-containing protein [Bacteroidales bacterium]|nr:PKD domain-containing protein [Bacteroidales bacterium]|tara:strand:+ start:2076 stop:4256 length:2181 start_codon:yes stop_codon:yes gene_type:complete
MKTTTSKSFLIILFIIIFGFRSFSQINQGGIPPSIEYNIIDETDKINLIKPSMNAIHEEDIIREATNPNAPQRMGISVKVNKTMSEIGTWTDIEGLGSIWRLEIKVEDAVALGVYYNDFYIPQGGKLFLYNKDRSYLIGAYTNINNPEESLFATEFIPGDVVILEYFKPLSVKEDAIISISNVAYAYRLIDFSFNKNTNSWYCMINVACQEGDNWEDQSKGIARMSIRIGGSYYWCSGSLINNTNNDRTPYFLSAAHCGEGSTSSDRLQWVFYFNFQSSTCSGSSSGYNSITGCQLKAKDQSYADSGSDFDLMKFNSSIPDSYDVYYNGWNRTNSADDAGSGVGIHHPAGDIKKISTYDTPLISSTFWNGLHSHWRLTWAETINGKSIMQGGSSGSPVFDSNGLIMGDLTGGYASNTCENPSPAYYGKVWYSWDKNGTTNSTMLKPWLDPGNTGIEKLPGVSWEIIPPEADFEAMSTNIIQGDTVFFSDLSGPSILEWSWTFEGGEPSTSDLMNPNVFYADTGYFDVSLTVTNADGTDTEIKSDFVYVEQMQLPITEFEANITTVAPGGVVSFTDLTLNNPDQWSWSFDGGSPSTSEYQNPTVRFNTPGIYNISLVTSNLGGSDSLLKEEYIHVAIVNIGENISDKKPSIYPNPSNGLFTIDFNNAYSSDVEIEIKTASGKSIQVHKRINTSESFIVDMNDSPNGIYLINIYNGTSNITQKIALFR